MAAFSLRLFVLLGLLLGVSATAAAADKHAPKPDWPAIRAVIADQLAAFRKDDDSRAFSHASPGIRKQFRTAQRFMDMVRESYFPLYRPRSTDFLEPAVIQGDIIQPLRVVAQDGTVLVALYVMERGADGKWKIRGCELAPSAAQSI
jgi:hypothetical protein